MLHSAHKAEAEVSDGEPAAAVRARTASALFRDVFASLPPATKLRFASTIVLALLTSVMLVIAPILFSRAVDLLSAQEAQRDPIGLIVASVIVFAAGKLLAEQRWLIYQPAENQMLNAIRAAYLRHVLFLPVSFHLDRSIGRLDAIVGRGMGGIQGVSSSLFTQIAPLLFEIVATVIATAAVLSLKIAGILAATIALYLLLLVLGAERVSRRFGAAISASVDAQGQAADAILNAEGVKTLAAEETVLRRYRGMLDKANRAFAEFYFARGNSALD
jgi:ATP-binding cassette subfamily B protein